MEEHTNGEAGRGGIKKEGREQRRLIIIKDGETARLAGSSCPGSYCKPAEHALCFAFIMVQIQKRTFSLIPSAYRKCI